MRVAAYQAPLLLPSSMDALELKRVQVKRCETESSRILCCPEAILGGLADNHWDPSVFAIAADTDVLKNTLSALASDIVTTIIGLSELANDGRIYNSAAVFQQGEVVGVYRKLHPAIRRSVYSAGQEVRVFTIGGFTFGIVICNDSNYPELARLMAQQGATALFVPTNNGVARRLSVRRGSATSLQPWRTTCGSSAPMSLAMLAGLSPSGHPRMGPWCNRPAT